MGMVTMALHSAYDFENLSETDTIIFRVFKTKYTGVLLSGQYYRYLNYTKIEIYVYTYVFVGTRYRVN